MNAELRRVPNLDEAYLLYEHRGRDEDLELLVLTGERLVAHFARVLTGGIGEDVIQAGMEGLMKAVSRFDKGYGASFATYAGHCIMGEIRHYVRKESSYFKLGSIARLQQKVNDVVEKVLKETGEPPTLSEIAGILNVKESGVVEAMRAGLVSLDDLDVKQIRSDRYETFRLPIEDRLLLEQAIGKLTSIQKRVIQLLFYRDLTQTQAAEELGISQRQVSRILHKSLREMFVTMKD